MKKNNAALVIINTITLVIMLFANYAYNTGVISNVKVSDISYKYNTLFAPSGFAFSIWSVIFILCIAFVIYQWQLLKSGDPQQIISRTGIWFTVSNIANASWLYFWTNEMIGWSVVIIILLLTSLVVLTIRLRLELDDAPVRTIVFVWWPITIYLGWAMVAIIANVAAWLVSIHWRGSFISEQGWTITMLVIAFLLYLFLLRKRNMREAAAVGIWAFIAIAVRQWNTNNIISICAIGLSLILLITTFIHAYKNRHYNIVAKLKRGEWN